MEEVNKRIANLEKIIESTFGKRPLTEENVKMLDKLAEAQHLTVKVVNGKGTDNDFIEISGKDKAGNLVKKNREVDFASDAIANGEVKDKMPMEKVDDGLKKAQNDAKDKIASALKKQVLEGQAAAGPSYQDRRLKDVTNTVEAFSSKSEFVAGTQIKNEAGEAISANEFEKIKRAAKGLKDITLEVVNEEGTDKDKIILKSKNNEELKSFKVKFESDKIGRS